MTILRQISKTAAVMIMAAALCLPIPSAKAANEKLDYEEYPTIRLRSLDKITARTLTFEAQVGTVIKFGDIYIKILACRKPPAVEKTESAAFLQIWEVDKVKDASRWIFSGWMFSSSPALSGMDHPVYDVWVIDCLGKDPDEMPAPIDTNGDKPLPDEGEVKSDDIKIPEGSPENAVPSTPTAPDEQEHGNVPLDNQGDATVDDSGDEPVPNVPQRPLTEEPTTETAPAESAPTEASPQAEEVEPQPQTEAPVPVAPEPPKPADDKIEGIY